MHEINPPSWFTLGEVADNYTHTFGANKKSRNYSVFASTQSRFFMLREGLLIYYVDEGHPKGCMDLSGCEVVPNSATGTILIKAGVPDETNLEISNIQITKEFLNWSKERETPLTDGDYAKVAVKEVGDAIKFHSKIAYLKKNFGVYFATLLANQEQAVIAGSEMWEKLNKMMKEIIAFLEDPSLKPIVHHSHANGGGAHPLVQKLWQSYAQLLYLQLEQDNRAENPYIPEMVDMYNRFVQSCLARVHIEEIDYQEYDNNDPTMGIVRLNQVLAIQGKFNEYVASTKMLIDFSLNKSGANLLASTQCILLAITLRDELNEAKQGKQWATKALEIFESSPNKSHHPLVFPGTEEERRDNLREILESFS
jgi:hypothetical protein